MRDRRSGNKLYPSHKLTLETDLPSRDIVMKNTCNKIQLINLMCEANTPHTLRMMGQDTCIYKHTILIHVHPRRKNVTSSAG